MAEYVYTLQLETLAYRLQLLNETTHPPLHILSGIRLATAHLIVEQEPEIGHTQFLKYLQIALTLPRSTMKAHQRLVPCTEETIVDLILLLIDRQLPFGCLSHIAPLC